MEDPIIVTGAARSGTSMSTGILSICGGFGGDMFGPNRNNQKGMFENKKIRQEIHKPYFSRIGADPLGQNPLPNKYQIFCISKEESEEFSTKIKSVIAQEGYKSGPWFYKGAKACLIWYHWHLAFPKAKWVIVRRNPQDIVNSCLRTGFMKAYNNQQGWKNWVKVHEQRFKEMKLAGLDIVEFWPTKAINGDMDYIEQYVKSVDDRLEWKMGEVTAFIDPKLYHEVATCQE